MLVKLLIHVTLANVRSVYSQLQLTLRMATSDENVLEFKANWDFPLTNGSGKTGEAGVASSATNKISQGMTINAEVTDNEVSDFKATVSGVKYQSNSAGEVEKAPATTTPE